MITAVYDSFCDESTSVQLTLWWTDRWWNDRPPTGCSELNVFWYLAFWLQNNILVPRTTDEYYDVKIHIFHHCILRDVTEMLQMNANKKKTDRQLTIKTKCVQDYLTAEKSQKIIRKFTVISKFWRVHSLISGGRQHYVSSYGRQCSVSLRWVGFLWRAIHTTHFKTPLIRSKHQVSCWPE